MFDASKMRMGRVIAIASLIGGLGLSHGCAGAVQTAQNDLEAARKAVHQQCHSQYNSCRQAAGASRGQKRACDQQLDRCLREPAAD